MKNQFYLLFFSVAMICFWSCQNETPKKITKQLQKTEIPATPPPAPINDSLLQRFENEILRFDTLDQENGLMKNGILFTGSSSIRMWSSLEKDMEGLPALNRGFGGATIPEVLHFMGRYVFQHEPQIIVLYCGENDISEGATPETVFASFKTFVKIIETRLPQTKMVYISMKPSIARWHLWGKYQAGDALIQKYIAEKPNIEYMDASLTMLEKDGQVRKDIFIEDGLHMNARGYEGWTNQLKPILEKIYQQDSK